LKTKHILPALLIAFVCIGAISCSEPTAADTVASEFSDEVVQLDSLQQEMQKAYDDLVHLDTSSFQEMARIYHSNMSLLSEGMLDTVTKETGIMLSDYMNIKKGFRSFEESYSSNIVALAFDLNQLETLKTDLNNGVIANTSNDSTAPVDVAGVGNAYYQKEMVACSESLYKANKWLDGLKRTTTLFEERNPAIEDYIAKHITKPAS